MKKLDDNAICFVCGKRFRDYTGMNAQGWCLVGCQLSRFDDRCSHGYVIDLCVICVKEEE